MAYVCACFRCAELLERYPDTKLSTRLGADDLQGSNSQMVQDYCELKRKILVEYSDRLSGILSYLKN